MTTFTKAEFYWAIVGDASPEPVAVVTENGRRVAYTCGCADPFVIDEGRIELIPDTHDPRSILPAHPMRIPLTPKERKKKREESERWLEEEKKAGRSHGHRRFNP